MAMILSAFISSSVCCRRVMNALYQASSPPARLMVVQIAGIAQFEEHVAAVTSNSTPDVGVQHTTSQRAVSSAGFAENTTPALTQCAISVVNVGDQFLDE